MKVHLVDGTYELFRQHFGQAARHDNPSPFAATVGVLSSTLALLQEGATHIGVASDHVIESYRNDLWPGYKTSEGMPPELLMQTPILEEALVAMGVTTWAMVEHEAHHRGQIYLMLNMLEVPTPPLYGLTSEEVRARSA